MPRPAATEADRSATLASALQPAAPWRVTAVEPLPGFRLRVTFVDGTSGEVDIAGLLRRPSIGNTVFAGLRDPATFAKATVVVGAVTWPTGADLAPDSMYDAIRELGSCVVE
jgi:hypothetical protein